MRLSLMRISSRSRASSCRRRSLSCSSRMRALKLLAAQLLVKVRVKWAREMACKTPDRTWLGHCLGRGIVGREGSPSMEASQKGTSGSGRGKLR